MIIVKTTKFSAASPRHAEYMPRVITPLFIISIFPLDFIRQLQAGNAVCSLAVFSQEWNVKPPGKSFSRNSLFLL
jgi:hypothetical protein